MIGEQNLWGESAGLAFLSKFCENSFYENSERDVPPLFTRLAASDHRMAFCDRSCFLVILLILVILKNKNDAHQSAFHFDESKSSLEPVRSLRVAFFSIYMVYRQGDLSESFRTRSVRVK